MGHLSHVSYIYVIVLTHIQAARSMLDGQIGITLNCDWAEPLTDSQDDKDAAERYLEFQLAWFADPVFFGKYPDSMVEVSDGWCSYLSCPAIELSIAPIFFLLPFH